jgi:CubicO group peptidase (beta-lactamase class C family)
MRRLLFAPVLVAALLVPGPVRAQQAAVAPPGGDIVSLFATYLEALRTQTGIPGLTAAIAGTEGVLWERAFGVQSVERGVPMRPDTPFQIDGLTEMFAATLVLRCVEAGYLSLDDTVGQFSPGSLDAPATLRQVLTHTTGAPDALVYTYRPDRLAHLGAALEACRGVTYRETFAKLLFGLGMVDSVPGPDVVLLPPQESVFPTAPALEEYAADLARLASSYAVDAKRRATPTQHPATTLTPASGLVATARDVALFDRAVRTGLLLEPATLLDAWTAPIGAGNKRLPHGQGWFVQVYNGETIVWQFGVADNAASSIVVSVPGRGLSLVLLANSQGLVRPFPLAAGDVTASPFAKLFLGYFVR